MDSKDVMDESKEPADDNKKDDTNKENVTKDEKSDVPVWEDRKKEWRDDDKVSEELEEVYASVVAGFDDKSEQTQVIERSWDVYNCVLNENQFYEGDSQVYLPIVHDAVEARVTRFSNSIFPETGRYSEVLSNDAKVPYETMALLDHYVQQCSLRDNIVPALMRLGDIEGQYSLFMSWQDKTRNTIKKKDSPILGDETGETADAGTIPDIDFEEVDDSRPDVMVLDARDLLISPASVDEVEDADVVAIALRLSKGKIQSMIDNEEIDEEEGEKLIKNMSLAGRDQQPNPDKKNLNAAGVKIDSKGNKTALVYMIWTKLKLGKKRRWCVAYMAGAQCILSCKRNPYWSDRIPVITQAALKVNGSIWGKSRIESIERAQYAANDAFNMGQDSIKYSLMPVVVVNPEKFNASSVVITMGAEWLGEPDAIKIIEFPDKWSDAERVVEMCKNQIMQSLGTNPAMLPMLNSGKKPTQAQISQEQQVALESTADVVTILENSVLNKMLRWFYELDYQFRTKDVHVRRFGPVGIEAEMQAVPPIGVDTHYTFKWYGTEGQKTAQQIQQMISFLGVIQKFPPEQMNGRKVDAGPIIEAAANNIFGPRIAPKVLIDQTHMLTISPDIENTMMTQGFNVPVNPMDNDVEHLKSHTQDITINGDIHGNKTIHSQKHTEQMKAKTAPPPQAQLQQGGPQAGAQPQAPTGPQQPPGAVRTDQMPMRAPQ